MVRALKNASSYRVESVIRRGGVWNVRMHGMFESQSSMEYLLVMCISEESPQVCVLEMNEYIVEYEVDEHVEIVETVHGQLPSSCDHVFVVFSDR